MLQIFVLLLMTYVGLLVGANKGDLLNPAALGTIFAGDRPSRRSAKVLDTSVIIDGRIADIAEAGFIDGMIVVPEFVLRELQVVADSTDASKRQRGRRGLDMLQRMQSNTALQVQIVPDDFPSIREVDLKLLELAKKWEAKVVTNDFNLNKVAHLHHVEVLNINDLANALKPVVLPGEHMNVLILKEGKEYNQGVGYLDDGTMVVVDHARKMIGRAVEISVTSVLQTASGKMIFGKMDENGRSAPAPMANQQRQRDSGPKSTIPVVCSCPKVKCSPYGRCVACREFHANAKRPRPPRCERKPNWLRRLFGATTPAASDRSACALPPATPPPQSNIEKNRVR